MVNVELAKDESSILSTSNPTFFIKEKAPNLAKFPNRDADKPYGLSRSEKRIGQISGLFLSKKYGVGGGTSNSGPTSFVLLVFLPLPPSPFSQNLNFF